MVCNYDLMLRLRFFYWYQLHFTGIFSKCCTWRWHPHTSFDAKSKGINKQVWVSNSDRSEHTLDKINLTMNIDTEDSEETEPSNFVRSNVFVVDIHNTLLLCH